MKPPDIEREFSAGERIVERGSAQRELYVIRSGEVRLEAAQGARTLLLGAGDVFGELSAILGEPQRCDAIADSDVVVLAVDLPLLNRLCAENLEFTLRLVAHLAERVASADGALGENAAQAVPATSLAQMARTLLERASSEDARACVEGELQDLAEAAGIPVREAYSCVQHLLEKRILRLVDDRLTLLEPERLRGLVA